MHRHEQQECITGATLDAPTARVARSHFAAIYHSVFHVRLSVQVCHERGERSSCDKKSATTRGNSATKTQQLIADCRGQYRS